MDQTKLINKIAQTFKKKVGKSLSPKLKSFYLVGSYAYGKISFQRPDINFLLIFDKFTTPDDYLKVGQICRELEDAFARQATIKIEFRPFRYIKPRYKNEFEVSINPIIVSTGEIEKMGGVIFNKWFTQGLKASNKLISGEDYLKELKIDNITKEDLVKGISFDLMFFTIPVSRAPAQYNHEESNLLLNEALNNAKNIIYLGIVAVMNNQELDEKMYVGLIENKEQIPSFYKQKYGDEAGRMATKVMGIRENYLAYKKNPEVAKEVFTIALNLGNIVRSKFYQSLHS